MIMTLGEVLLTCTNWVKFCNEKGFSVWAVNEGGEDIQVALTIDEAREFGILSTGHSD